MYGIYDVIMLIVATKKLVLATEQPADPSVMLIESVIIVVYLGY